MKLEKQQFISVEMMFKLVYFREQAIREIKISLAPNSFIPT